MNSKSKRSRPHGIAVLSMMGGLAAAASGVGITPTQAGSLEEAACYAFGGQTDCRTVKVFDAEECIIKVHPQPLPILDPLEAACLRDEVQTKMVFLKKAGLPEISNSNKITFRGNGVVEVLEKYDEIGAAVWTPKNAGVFEIKGSVAQTRKAFKQIASEHCVGQSQIVGGGTSGGMITAREAFKQASQGSIVLIDIRHPSEWAKTGIGANAVPITMHQKLSKFVDELIKVAGPEKRPIALICAEGVRSAAMQKRLMPYGFKGVINVSEGMIGSKSGPGWIESELPVKHVNHQQASIGQ